MILMPIEFVGHLSSLVTCQLIMPLNRLHFKLGFNFFRGSGGSHDFLAFQTHRQRALKTVGIL